MQQSEFKPYNDSFDRFCSCSLSSAKHRYQGSYCIDGLSPAQTNPLTICLDLDNTLILSTTRAPPICDFIIKVDGEDVFVVKRPFLDNFLAEVSKIADIYLFTSAEEEYVNQILEYLDPFDRIFKKKFYRDSCRLINGIYVKDIRICGVDLSKIAIVDDYENSYCLTPYNGIYIKPFVDIVKDCELNRVFMIIKQMLYLTDVRTLLQ